MNAVNYSPSHPNDFQVQWGREGTYASSLISLRDFDAGSVMVKLGQEIQPTHEKAYTSVQFKALSSTTTTTTSTTPTTDTDTPTESDTPINTHTTTDNPEPPCCHMELCSDLVFINHSCSPNVSFELPGDSIQEGLDKGLWVLRALKDIKKGDTLSFAYFSTEWDMIQPFDCLCGSTECLGRIQGARYIPSSILEQYFINDHILELKRSEGKLA